MSRHPHNTASETPRAPSLQRNIAYAISARVFMALSQFAILAIIVHMGLPQDVGALTLASAIVTPLFFLTSMGMNEVHTVDDFDRFTRADYVALRFFAGIVAIGLTILVVVFFQGDESRLVQLTAIAFSLVRFFGAQSSLIHGVFQRDERLNFVAVSTIGRGSIGLVVFATTFWLTRNLPLALLCEAVAWFFSYFVVDRALLVRMNAQTQFAQLRQVRARTILALAWWVLPIGVALWMTRASASVPPMVLARYTDLAAVGLFGTLAYVHSALSMAVGPMGTASAARLRKYYREGRARKFSRLTCNLALFAGLIGLCAVAFGWFLGDVALGLVFGDTYRNAELFTIILLGTAVSIIGMQLLTAVTAAQAFNHRLLSSALGLVAAMIAALVLIPSHGVYGAGWAMVVMAVVRLIFALTAFRIVLGKIPQARGDAPSHSIVGA